MNYFKKMSSVSGGIAPRPPPRLCPGPHWGTSVLQTTSLTTPGKNPAGAHGQSEIN